MGYVKTPEEVAAARQLLKTRRYGLETISVTFSTEGRFVREVLPPCFTPSETPRGLVRFGRNMARGDQGETDLKYNYCACYVRAKYGDFEGWYHLTMLLSEDMGVFFGRELYGEAKKVGEVRVEFTDSAAHGYGSRKGYGLLELHAQLGPELDVKQGGDHALGVKAFLDVFGQDLEYDPIVILERWTSEVISYREGTGTVELNSSPMDPCGTLPVGEIEKAVYEKSFSTFEFERIPLPSADGYFPYVLGRKYDVYPSRPDNP